MSHPSLLDGEDEPKTLPYAITLICPIGADGEHDLVMEMKAGTKKTVKATVKAGEREEYIVK